MFVVKRFYSPEWGSDWRSHFTVGLINGRLGNALRLDGEKINVNMLRVGFETDGSWRLFGLRHDFSPAVKVQTEDDITASVVIGGHMLGLDDDRSYKLVENCEQLLFQRPDDAIHRGYDKQAEADIACPGHVLVELPAADPRRRDRDARRRGGVQPVHRADAHADQHLRRLARRFSSPAVLRVARRTRAWSTASPARTRATCRQRPDRHQRHGHRGRRPRLPPGAQAAVARSAAAAGRRRRGRTPEQPAGGHGSAAVLVQPAALHGAAGAVHGVHLLDDRQVAVDHRRRLRGRDDQGPVQRACRRSST